MVKKMKVKITNVPAQKLQGVIADKPKRRGGGSSRPSSPELTSIEEAELDAQEQQQVAPPSPAPQIDRSIRPQGTSIQSSVNVASGIPKDSQARPTFKSTIKAIGNVGLIGQQGVSAYWRGIFPEYKGEVERVEDRRYYARGTSVGEGGRVLQNPTNIGKATYQEEIKTGEILRGVSPNLAGLPNEAKASALRSQYQGRLDKASEGVTTQAEADALASQYTAQLQSEYAKVSSKSVRTRSYNPYETATRIGLGVASIPIASTIVGGVGLGAYSLGRGGTRISQAILANQLPTSERLKIGAFGVAEVVIGTTLIRGGYNRLYSQWRADIVSDAMSRPARLSGREVVRDGYIETSAIATRRTASASINEITRVRTFPSSVGEGAGVYSKSISRIKIFDPQSQQYITSREVVTFTGNIPSTKELPVYFNQPVSTYQATAGVATGTFKTSRGIQFNKQFYGISQEVREGTFAVSGGEVKYAFGNQFTRRGYLGKAPSYFGVVTRESTSEFTSFYGGGALKTSSGAGSIPSVATGVGGSATRIGTRIATTRIIGQTSRTQVASSGLAIQATRYSQGQSPQLNLRSRQAPLISSPQTQTPTQRQRAFPIVSARSGQVQIARQQDLAIVTQAQAQPQATSPRQRFGLRLTPTSAGGFRGTPSGFSSNFRYGFAFPDIEIGADYLRARSLRGGRGSFAYTPSYSALVFRITGRARNYGARETGFSFRPIAIARRRKRRKR